MIDFPIPPHAIGRVGMVALLHKAKSQELGRLVVVRCPVGTVGALADQPRPVFAWQVLALGPEPIERNGKGCRELVVADHCLQPVCQLEPAQVDALVKARAYRDFYDALADLRRCLERRPMTPAQLSVQIARAAEQALIQHMLEILPTAVALDELHFKPAGAPGEEVWHWAGAHQGVTLYLEAAPDQFGRWTITGRRLCERRPLFDDRNLMGSEPRGKIFKAVLELWRSAFGSLAPVPKHLDLGLRYERGVKDICRIGIRLPTLEVDGKVLRTTWRWLTQRYGMRWRDWGPLPDVPMKLSYSDGLLRIETPKATYGCPAQGFWLGDCTVSLREFLAMPEWYRKGRHINLERALEVIAVNGRDLRVLEDAEGS